MRFYNREHEIAKLQEVRELSYNDHSRLTVVTGRRRIGKTSLISKAMGEEPFIYLFVGRKNEASLCAGYCKEIASKLGVFVPSITSFQELFVFLMQLGETKKFTLVIDEFQEFFNVNASIYSDIQNYWDQYRLKTHINFIVSGSIYSLMTKIFQHYHEPLFGRADVMLKLNPFALPVLKQIIADHYPTYTNDDLLALYTVTGGIPKYVELLVDAKALSVKKIIHAVCDVDSPFKEEGKHLLIDDWYTQHQI
jgi:AAA+ ATPase superfamily predicted ATPase